ncbi:hypothetical protein QYE76_057369 [Lolium multiflorum]|uniref:ATPase AAA-type core domain-containing protein n=1 Tax=Lolium multiflorum TaxID=4521 RepID=A0AAD8T4W8_LOLMU|nr:hypothetical protein QYE76_057369 [Lolium multiflorum]
MEDFNFYKFETQASQVTRPVLPAFSDGREVLPATAILPKWLRCYRTIPASLQADVRITPLHQLAAHRRPKFTELTTQNLKILCDALELCYPGHGDIVPGISSTVLLCRSGMTRRRVRKNTSSPLPATTTCLLFLGKDSGGKTAVARELARLVFGSYAEFTALQVGSSDEPTRGGKLALKRRRSLGNGNGGYALGRLFKEIVENPHRVILIDGVDWLDPDSQMHIKDAMMKGTARGCNGDVVGLEDAIVVLCSDVLDARCVVSSPQVKGQLEDGDATGKDVRSCCRLGLDLNAFPEVGEDEEDTFADDDEAILNFVDGVFFFK